MFEGVCVRQGLGWEGARDDSFVINSQLHISASRTHVQGSLLHLSLRHTPVHVTRLPPPPGSS